MRDQRIQHHRVHKMGMARFLLAIVRFVIRRQISCILFDHVDTTAYKQSIGRVFSLLRKWLSSYEGFHLLSRTRWTVDLKTNHNRYHDFLVGHCLLDFSGDSDNVMVRAMLMVLSMGAPPRLEVFGVPNVTSVQRICCIFITFLIPNV